MKYEIRNCFQCAFSVLRPLGDKGIWICVHPEGGDEVNRNDMRKIIEAAELYDTIFITPRNCPLRIEPIEIKLKREKTE